MKHRKEKEKKKVYVRVCVCVCATCSHSKARSFKIDSISFYSTQHEQTLLTVYLIKMLLKSLIYLRIPNWTKMS